MKRYGIYSKDKKLSKREIRSALTVRKTSSFDHRGGIIEGDRFKTKRPRRR